MQLSKAQERIVNAKDRVVQVIAAAGSGKTRTLVELIDRRVGSGQVDPARCLVLSFSRKACAEIRDRLSARSGGVNVSTFHSLAYRAMRDTWSGRILTDSERMRFLRVFLQSRDTQGVPYQILMSNKQLFRSHMPVLCMETYRALAAHKRDGGYLEFDDLVRGMLLRLRRGELTDLCNAYDLVIVDEFQDTDPEQLEFLRHLKFKQLLVVGDDYQSIYSFRGSDPSIFLEFRRYFEDAVRYYLVENYRSLRPITDCGNGVIRSARHRLKKRVVSVRGRGRLPSAAALSIGAGQEERLSSILASTPGAQVLCRSNHRLLVWERAGLRREQLSTIHSAKGLEFPVVFLDLIGGWSGLRHVTRVPDEEVRVSYVGLTRAQNLLVVLHSDYGPREPERLVFEMFRSHVRSRAVPEMRGLVEDTLALAA